ncbi:adenosylmethionine decarboxylase [Candidatus Woesearchaeota archaeon]|nr:adenosylmethionine decarboxylase [Candidatus Woesearchaeota archaeon]
MNQNIFGPHLTLDLSGCNKEKLKDLDFVFGLLNNLPDMIGMTKITQPFVFPYSGLVPEDKGITGVIIIAESHISVHTFQEKDYVFIDIFSCKPFDYEKAAEFLIRAFEAREVEKNVVQRGLNFPREGNSEPVHSSQFAVCGSQ